MPKSREDVRRRLQQAALELYGERGYDQTTTAQIAARAGVTERTFFRHFSDKREVLFDGEAVLRAALTSAIADAPKMLGPLETLVLAFRSVEQMLEDNLPFSRPRQQVIASTPALQEREMAKVASLTATLASMLHQRGVDNGLATLSSRIGMTTFSYAVACWFDEPSMSLGMHITRAFDELRALSFDGSKLVAERTIEE